MPNWCEGTLRARGSKENLTEFLKKSLVKQIFEPPLFIKEEPVQIDDELEEIEIPQKTRIIGLGRCFIEADYIFPRKIKNSKLYVVAIPCKTSWSFKAETLLDLATKYKIDIRVYGFELGMEFNQDIEIIDGKITKDNCIEFDDYDWDCIMPSLGG